MSINTLARQAIEKRAAAPPPANLAANAAIGHSVPTQEDALSGIAKYIPTEVITLFLFGLSVLPKSTDDYPGWVSVECLYWALLAFTPFCFYMIFAAKFRVADPAKRWPRCRDLPWFRLIAATLGFCIWAAAVPKSGLIDERFAVIVGFGALTASTVFSLIEQAFEPKITVSAT
jgi:hypothetical protein